MKTEERQRLSALLKELRGDASIRSFCGNRGIHYSAWRQWETCESVPGYENLEKVATLRGWTMDQLLAYLRTGDENENPFDIEIVVAYIKGLPDSERMSLIKRLL
jgi:hypothetical protein